MNDQTEENSKHMCLCVYVCVFLPPYDFRSTFGNGFGPSMQDRPEAFWLALQFKKKHQESSEFILSVTHLTQESCRAMSDMQSTLAFQEFQT